MRWQNTQIENYKLIYDYVIRPQTFWGNIRLLCVMITPVVLYNWQHMYLLVDGWSFTMLFWWSCIHMFWEWPLEGWQLFMYQAVENIYILELRHKIAVSENNIETLTQLQEELYNALMGDKLKAAAAKLAWEEPNYDKMFKDVFFNRMGRFMTTFR
jgi:hypothetical protein